MVLAVRGPELQKALADASVAVGGVALADFDWALKVRLAPRCSGHRVAMDAAVLWTPRCYGRRVAMDSVLLWTLTRATTACLTLPPVRR